MSVSELSTEQKSVMLAKLCGWKITQGVSMFWVDTPKGDEELFKKGNADLYDPANMALAWRVLNWAIENFLIPNHIFQLRQMVNRVSFFVLSPNEAQRMWLDKILELAIEAGLVELEAEQNDHT